MKEIILKISGMTCASCSSSLEKEFNKVIGIDKAIVNIATEKAVIKYDEKTVSFEDIDRVIKKLGFSINRNKNDIDIKSKELKVQFYKVLFSFIFSIPLLYIAMAPMIPQISFPYPEFLDPILNTINFSVIQLTLTIPVIFMGYKFYTKGFKNLFLLRPNMDSLVAIGTSAAFLYSMYSTYRVINGDHMSGHNLYFESTAIIISLILLGKYLEMKSKGKTGEAVRKLIDLSPKFANVLRDGNFTKILVEDIVLGDIIIVKPGERVPTDGEIIEGDTTIDESMITGESIPVDKSKGDKLVGASININGNIKFLATSVGDDTVLSKIIKMIEEAQGSKAPIAKLADKISGYFVPIVILIAIISSFAWIILGKDFIFALEIFISVLVIACPCALGLATPTSIMVGTGKAAENGILFKNAEALEIAHNVNTIILDKTGTITYGKPEVTDIICYNGYDEEYLIRYSSSVENKSEHPLAKAIVNYAIEKRIELEDYSDFIATIGQGVQGKFKDGMIYIGNKLFMKNNNIDISLSDKDQKKFLNNGKAPIYISLNNILIGIIGVSDVVKETSAKAISILKKLNIKTYMITGDNENTAKYIGDIVKVDNVYANVLPEDKANKVKLLQNENIIVAMVGDGINDAPALVQADIGVSVGNGTDIAIESADVILVKNDLLDVVNLFDISKSTIKNIKQNLFWAFLYNILGIPFAAGIFYAMGGPLLNPMIAALAMSLSSISVVLNALRLNNFKKRI